MPMQRFKIALNQSRLPTVPSQYPRAALLPQLDVAPRSASRAFFGSEENADFDVPNLLWAENVVPIAQGIKSVSYKKVIDGIPPAEDFDQIFPLRDDEENQVLFSPADGQDYVLNAGVWTPDPLPAKWAAEAPPRYLSADSVKTLATAQVNRAYVDGKTFVSYEKIGLAAAPAGTPIVSDGSVYLWDPVTISLRRVKLETNTDIVRNLSIPLGQVGGVSSSNGYLLAWSGLSIHWALFNGTSFDYTIYDNGAVTGSGNQIPEDIKGPITAVAPVSGGFIIFTSRNAVAAFYNANNFASPWIFKEISNAGGVENFELVTVDSAPSAIFAYTSGGLQRISLNSAETFAPDVSDFLGNRLLERFDVGTMQFSKTVTTIEFFVKLTYTGNRFLVISVGLYPGVYSYALIFDTGLQRWGRLRIAHRDAFLYQVPAEEVPVTYGMLLDVPYSDLDGIAYEDLVVSGSGVTYPRQALAFLLRDGTVKLAVMDFRDKDEDDDSEAFVLIGKVQLSRSSNVTLHEVEVEGLSLDGNPFLRVLHMPNGVNIVGYEEGVVREAATDYTEYGIDMLTGKTFSVLIGGVFSLSTIIMHTTPEASNY